MEVYHLVRDGAKISAQERLRSILARGLLAGEHGEIYARPFEPPKNLEWVSFDVDPKKAIVTDQRLQGTSRYDRSAMTLRDYLKRSHCATDVKYMDFLLSTLGRNSSYLPEVHIRERHIDTTRLIRYCDGQQVRSV